MTKEVCCLCWLTILYYVAVLSSWASLLMFLLITSHALFPILFHASISLAHSFFLFFSFYSHFVFLLDFQKTWLWCSKEQIILLWETSFNFPLLKLCFNKKKCLLLKIHPQTSYFCCLFISSSFLFLSLTLSCFRNSPALQNIFKMSAADIAKTPSLWET